MAKGRWWEERPSRRRSLSCGLKAENESAMQGVQMLWVEGLSKMTLLLGQTLTGSPWPKQ